MGFTLQPAANALINDGIRWYASLGRLMGLLDSYWVMLKKDKMNTLGLGTMSMNARWRKKLEQKKRSGAQSHSKTSMHSRRPESIPLLSQASIWFQLFNTIKRQTYTYLNTVNAHVCIYIYIHLCVRVSVCVRV